MIKNLTLLRTLLLLMVIFSHWQLQAQMPSDLDQTYGSAAYGGRPGLAIMPWRNYEFERSPTSTKILVSNNGDVFMGGRAYINPGLMGFGVIKLNSKGFKDTNWGPVAGATIRDEGSNAGITVSDYELQADGKIIGVGYGRYYDGLIARFNADGTPDNTFGTNGLVVEHITGEEIFKDAVVQQDGKILVAGHVVSYSNLGERGYYGLLVRYNSNGTLDQTFGGNGTIYTKAGSLQTRVNVGATTKSTTYNNVMVLPDGKIVTVGYAGDYYEKTIIVRYNSDGSLDTTFGIEGVAAFDFTGNTTDYEYGKGIQLKKDGTYLLGGMIRKAPVYFGSVVNVNPDGTLNTAFGENGVLKLNLWPDGYTQVVIEDIQYDRNGDLFVSGGGYWGFVFKMTNDGKVDQTFYNNPSSSHALHLNQFNGQTMLAFDSNNKLLVTGFTANSGRLTSYRLMNARPVVPAGALNFDGMNDGVLISNHTALQVHTGTIESWVKTSDAGQSYRGTVVKQLAYGLFLKDNVLMTFDWKTRQDISTGINLADDKWHHIAMTFKDGIDNGSNIYLDGELVKTFTYNLLSHNEPLVLGNGASSPGFQSFRGSMDELRIWSRALSQAEIQNNMQGELPAYQTDLLAYYKFNQGNSEGLNTTVTTLIDEVGSHPGSLLNFALAGSTSNWIEGIVAGTAPPSSTPTAVIRTNGPTVFCPSGSVTLTTDNVAGFTYQWIKDGVPISGQTTGSYVARISGSYNVIVSSNGSTAMATPVTVVVEDLTPPSISAPLAINVFTDPGKCGAIVGLSAPATQDNCGVMSVSHDAPLNGFFPTGTTTVTWTVTDLNGLSQTATQVVTVKDNQAPQVSVAATQILCFDSTFDLPDLQASDNCGLKSITYEITGATSRSGNGNSADGSLLPGVNKITWTAIDVNGNESTATSDITVNFPVSVSIVDAYALKSGVSKNTIYPGYAPASSLTLTAAPSGGVAGYTYLWSTGASSSSISVAAAGTYSVVISDSKGCTATVSKIIKAVGVVCGSGNSDKNDKVAICHNGNMICIAPSAVAAHLAHGCLLDPCENTFSAKTSAKMSTNAEPSEVNLTVSLSIYPNPTKGMTNIEFSMKDAGSYSVEVYNLRGNLMKMVAKGTSESGQLIRHQLDATSYPEGLYSVRLKTNRQLFTKMFIVGQSAR